jgi:DNA-binding response OmpR family regulator
MKKILVIEDQTEVRENICEILELAGYEAHAASDGKVGCEQAINQRPDLILCDVMMPKLDGFGVLKILRQKPETRSIPLIFLTAKVELSDLRKGMGLGADDYITKPFDDTELLEAIELRLRKRDVEMESVKSYKDNLGNLHSEAREQNSLNQLTSMGKEECWAKGEQLWQLHQHPVGMYYITKGYVKESLHHSSGKELLIGWRGPGEFIGYAPLLSENTYSSTATAMEAVQAKFINANSLSSMMFENRDIALFFLRQTLAQSEQLQHWAVDHAYSSVRRRVAQALLYLHQQGDASDIVVGRDDLAALAGTAKETTIRTLSDFKSEGNIEIEGGAIHLLQPEALADIEY